MPNLFNPFRFLDSFPGPIIPTMEYIDMKRLAAMPNAGIAGAGRPPADRNRATTTSTSDGIPNVTTQPPIMIRNNTEFCTTTKKPVVIDFFEDALSIVFHD